MPEHPTHLAKPRAPDAFADRARAIVDSLRAGEPSAADMFDAFWQLDRLPPDEVRDALTAWTGPLPDPNRLDPATRRAHGLPMPPLHLRTLSVARDADVLDQGPVAEEQLRIAGKSWDGADLAPEERLDGELEGSFAGTLERRVLADADASRETPVFDVLLFAEDSGVVFGAGTTRVLAFIAYGKVEMRDGRTRRALEAAIAAPSSVMADEAAAPLTRVAASPVVSPAAVLPVAVASVAAEIEEEAVAPEKVPALGAAKKAVKKAAPKKGASKAAAKGGEPLAKKAAKPATKKAAKPAAKKAAKPAAKKAAKPAAKKAAKPVPKKPIAAKNARGALAKSPKAKVSGSKKGR